MASPWGSRKGSKSGGQKGGRKRDKEYTNVPKMKLPGNTGCGFAERLRITMVEQGFEDWVPDLSMFELPPCKPLAACNDSCPIYSELIKQIRRAKNGV